MIESPIQAQANANKPPISGAGQMTAAVITAPQQVVHQQVSIPQIQAAQVLVRLEGCGLCGSNVPLWEGREWFDYPRRRGIPPRRLGASS
ncbi:MAG: hypothetical protein R2932_38915 [Caldilineaceae bacterium]